MLHLFTQSLSYLMMSDSVFPFTPVTLQTGKSVTSASISADGKFIVKIEKRTIDYVDFIEADYLLMASGSSQQVSFLSPLTDLS